MKRSRQLSWRAKSGNISARNIKTIGKRKNMVLVGTREYRMGRMIMSHMAADNLEELFEMAEKIGVVCKEKKALAIARGAKLVHDREIILMLKT